MADPPDPEKDPSTQSSSSRFEHGIPDSHYPHHHSLIDKEDGTQAPTTSPPPGTIPPAKAQPFEPTSPQPAPHPPPSLHNTHNANANPLTTILTHLSHHQTHDPGPPPEGGLRAWLQVFAGHLVVMNTWGFINSFGTFETYYVSSLSRPPSDIAWIGSTQVFFLFFIGTWSGRATDAGYFRLVFFLGSALQVIGLFCAAQATLYWHLFLAQGLTLGFAAGCLFTPTMSVLSTYFVRRRALALALAACGSASGGLLFPAIVQQLLPRVGFPWTMRTLGFLSLGTMTVANLLARPRLPPRRSGPLVEWPAWKNPTYAFVAIGMFFSFLGAYFPFFYLGAYARDVIKIPYTQSLNLILLLNAMGAPGRLVPNFLSDALTGPVNIMILALFSSGVIILALQAVHSEGGLYAWAAFYGITGAAIQSLFPPMVASLTSERERDKMGVRMGMIFTVTAFAVLVGPPVEGVLVRIGGGSSSSSSSATSNPSSGTDINATNLSEGDDYTWACVFAGLALLLGTGCLVVARVARSGWVLRVKM